MCSKALSHDWKWFSILALLLTACSAALPGPEATSSPSPSSAPTGTSTLTAPPPTGTNTPQPTPTSTTTPLPTSTPTSIVMVEPGTPIPPGLPFISYENAARVSGLAQFTVGDVTDLDWSPDGGTLAVAGYSALSIFDALSRVQLRELETRPGVVSIDYNPFGSLLGVGHQLGSEEDDWAGVVDVWRVSSWEPLGPIMVGDQGVNQVLFSPGGNTLASAFLSAVHEDNQVVFWDTLGWEISRTLQTGAAQNIAFSPDGQLLAVSPDLYAIEIYRLEDGKQVQTLYTSFTGAVNALAFSPDGNSLASGHYDGAIGVWNPLSGDLLHVLRADGVVDSLSYNRDGTILASGQGVDTSSIELWDIEIGQRLRTLDIHPHPVVSLEFSPDGSLLASGSFDGTVWLWGVRP